MKPFLKHSGGKAREIKNFLSHIPNNFNRYIEPFVGGGAVFWYLEPKSAIINDLNKNLIECYKSVKFDYNTISSELDELVKNYSVDLHNQINILDCLIVLIIHMKLKIFHTAIINMI